MFDKLCCPNDLVGTNKPYRCLIFLSLHDRKKWIVEYPKIPSAIHQVRHGDDLPISQSPEGYKLQADEGGNSAREDTYEPPISQDPNFVS